jgi:hypothetical protein
VLDGRTYEEISADQGSSGVRACRSSRPDGKYGLRLLLVQSARRSSSPSPITRSSGESKQDKPVLPNIAATPDGSQVWLTLKDTAEDAGLRCPSALHPAADAGHRTDHNHVNFAHNAGGTFAYVTVGGLNQVKAFRTDDFSQVATIPVGNLPHGSGRPETVRGSTSAWRTRMHSPPSIPGRTR